MRSGEAVPPSEHTGVPGPRTTTRQASPWTPAFRTLFAGQAVSALGDWMVTVALIALVHDLTGSATAVGGVLVIRLLPTVIGGAVAGRLARRWSPRRTMLVMDAVRIPVVLVTPWVEALWWVYLWAFVADLAGLLFLPARDASIPDLVAADGDLAVANGLILGSSYGMIPVGAAAFALVSLLADRASVVDTAKIVFAVDAATFALSWLAISRLPERDTAGPDGEDASVGEVSFGAALRLPMVRRLAPAAGAVAVGLGALFTIGVIWVTDVLHASDTEFALLVACFGVGAAAGMIVLRAVEHRDFAMVRSLLVVQGAVVAGMSLTPTVVLALCGAAAFGATSAAVLATSMELVQRRLDDCQRVLAFTVFHVVIRGGLALAAIVAGVVEDLFDRTRWPLVGALESSQVVLLSSGLLVVVVALASRRVLDADPAVP